MLLHSLFFSYLLTCVITDQAYGWEFSEDLVDVFPSWPSNQHVVKAALQKRQAEVSPVKPGQSETNPLHVIGAADAKKSNEGETGVQAQVSEGNVQPGSLYPPKATTKHPEIDPSSASTSPKTVSETVPGNTTQNASVTVPSSTTSPTTTTKTTSSTSSKVPTYQPDLSNPGVMKRGLIVFGAFALMAVAYFIFYRRKSKSNDSNNTHGSSDTNQFRYGVLQSDDRRDNLELSRIPLTMESDEDEDEDLEIFDLEQKKKSLSYVNLQTSDEYVVHESREGKRDRDNLLLDIEDANSDTLINWSSNGNKSIL